MPELPEVETIRTGLQEKIVGLEIANILVLNPKTFQGDPEKLRGKIVLKVWRRAKILGIDLDQGLTLLFHLKMSGQLIYQAGSGKRKDGLIGGHPTPDMVGQMPNKSTRVIIEFGDGGDLYFNDQRKFGWIKVFATSEIDPDKLMTGLGPEPLEKEFTWEVLKARVGKHPKLPIKVAVMDQKAIAGVGNIYASEGCFNARIDPKKRVGDLTDSEWKKLHRGLVKALSDGVKYGGSTRTHFVNTDGKPGLFLDYANVYQKNGTPCKRCKTELKKIVLGGRGTYFCPKCQK